MQLFGCRLGFLGTGWVAYVYKSHHKSPFISTFPISFVSFFRLFGLETSRGALGEVEGLAGFNFTLADGRFIFELYGKSKSFTYNNMDEWNCFDTYRVSARVFIR
jgi:hypothetical protein